MIVQQYPTSEITKKILQEYYSNIGEEVPDEYLNPSYKTLTLERTKGLLYDSIRDSSLLFDKIDIAKVLPDNISILAFEEPSGQLSSGTIDDNTVLEKYNGPLRMVTDEMLRTSPYNTTASAIKKFIVFVKVVGIIDLQLCDVYLSEDEGGMTISVAETHPIYTGSLRIETW